MAEEQEEELLRRFADYSRRADEAEAMAAKARDGTARDSFQMVASGWRQLAEQTNATLKRMAAGK